MIERVRFTKVDRLGLVTCTTVALGALGIMYIGHVAATTDGALSATVSGTAENGTSLSITAPGSATLDLTLVQDEDGQGVESSTSDAQETSGSSTDESASSTLDEDGLSMTTNIDLTIDSDEPASVKVDEQDISIDVANTGTLDGSDNEHDIDIERDIDVDQNTSNRGSRTRTRINVDAGNNEVSGNDNAGTIDNGNVNVDFSFR